MAEAVRLLPAPFAFARDAPRLARRELVVTWARCLAVLAVAGAIGRFIPLLGANLAGVAAFLFVTFPERKLQARGARWSDFGFAWWGWCDRRSWGAWLRGLVAASALCAVVFPLFFLGFWSYSRALPWLSPQLAALLAPYAAPRGAHFRWPAGFPLMIAIQLLVVALPEELFYRGWIQTTWRESDPRRVRVLGAQLGRGFVITQLLFALGHLVILKPWRLGTFFPGLLFGWLRERTGGLAAPIFFHALCNLFLAVLEASFYG